MRIIRQEAVQLSQSLRDVGSLAPGGGSGRVTSCGFFDCSVQTNVAWARALCNGDDDMSSPTNAAIVSSELDTQCH
eukprot:m.447417 g.447417  ORF g.447417 m.447417 type:complete len:76 (+) comp19512_c0_seq1:532-759(+)